MYPFRKKTSREQVGSKTGTQRVFGFDPEISSKLALKWNESTTCRRRWSFQNQKPCLMCRGQWGKDNRLDLDAERQVLLSYHWKCSKFLPESTESCWIASLFFSFCHLYLQCRCHIIFTPLFIVCVPAPGPLPSWHSHSTDPASEPWKSSSPFQKVHWASDAFVVSTGSGSGRDSEVHESENQAGGGLGFKMRRAGVIPRRRVKRMRKRSHCALSDSLHLSDETHVGLGLMYCF